MQTTRHAVYGNLSHCACTICVQICVYYVTTVTTMSSEGAKSASLVVWLAGHLATERQRKRRKSKKKVAFEGHKATERQRKRRKSKKKVAFAGHKVTKRQRKRRKRKKKVTFDRHKPAQRQRKRRKRNYSGSPPTHSHFEHFVFFSRL